MKPLIIANWKAHKTIKETAEFFNLFKDKTELTEKAEIVICPPFVDLPLAYALSENTPITIGAQNVSQFERGPYTGEVTAEMLSGLAKYCLVGHSERRKYFAESNDIIRRKVALLEKYKIIPVLCAQNEKEIPSNLETEKLVLVYEPSFAISGDDSFHPDDPSNVLKMASLFSEMFGGKHKVLYGGSVNAENVAQFVRDNTQGVLVGQASLEVNEFDKIISSLGV